MMIMLEIQIDIISKFQLNLTNWHFVKIWIAVLLTQFKVIADLFVMKNIYEYTQCTAGLAWLIM